jgi:hypothetical protein
MGPRDVRLSVSAYLISTTYVVGLTESLFLIDNLR